jgi:hypothetical protein
MALQLPSASGTPSWLACLQVRLLVPLPCCVAVWLSGCQAGRQSRLAATQCALPEAWSSTGTTHQYTSKTAASTACGIYLARLEHAAPPMPCCCHHHMQLGALSSTPPAMMRAHSCTQGISRCHADAAASAAALLTAWLHLQVWFRALWAPQWIC